MNSRPPTPPVARPEPHADAGHSLWFRSLVQIVWPAFLGAAVGTGVLFSIVDPLSIDVVVRSLGGSREAAYTIGFIGLWLLLTLSCSLTWVLASTESRRMQERQADDARGA